MDNIARLFPYVALSAFYKSDSGDGDSNTMDKIEDTIREWDNLSTVTRIYTSCDFTYVAERYDEVKIICLGTQGWDAWKENADVFPLKNGVHNGFDEAGNELEKELRIFVKKRKRIIMAGHSRGGPRVIRSGELLFDRYGKRIPTIAYNSPDLYTRKGRRRWRRKKLPLTVVEFPRDIVDNTGLGVLVHVGKRVRMPFKRTFINSIPIIGWLIGGHAYSSDYESLIKYYSRRGKRDEVHYLEKRKLDGVKI